MKVVLLKEVPKLGEADEALNVKDGFARNYLLPQKLAVPASAAVLAGVEKRKSRRELERAEKIAELTELAKKLGEAEITISADVGEEGRLFGSVTAAEIAQAIKTSLQIEVDKRKIDLAEPIKIIGDYQVPVKLFREVSAELKVKVIAKA